VIFVDGGELNFGIVRDPTLNQTNDAELFVESFENTLRLAGEVLILDIDICPDGTTSAPRAISVCNTGS
jgi:hypothetical protein